MKQKSSKLVQKKIAEGGKLAAIYEAYEKDKPKRRKNAAKQRRRKLRNLLKA